MSGTHKNKVANALAALALLVVVTAVGAIFPTGSSEPSEVAGRSRAAAVEEVVGAVNSQARRAQASATSDSLALAKLLDGRDVDGAILLGLDTLSGQMERLSSARSGPPASPTLPTSPALQARPDQDAPLTPDALARAVDATYRERRARSIAARSASR